MAKSEVVVVREFDAELFHKKVMEMEAVGWVAKRETYRVVAEMSPEDGKIVHLHSMEMGKEST